MKLSELDQKDETVQIYTIISSVIARRSINKYELAIDAIGNMLQLSNGDAKKLAHNATLRFNKKKSTYTNSALTTLDRIEFDILLNEMSPFYHPQTPKLINEDTFNELAEQVHNMTNSYAKKEYDNAKMKGKNIYKILEMIHQNQLDELFDRIFTKEESYVCSHDKTVNVLKQLKKAIISGENIALITYFAKDEKPELAGKKTYWSTNVFKDTNEVIEFLTKQFYL